MEWMGKLYQDDSGAGAIEYAILLACIAIAIIGAVAIFGNAVKGLYGKANAIFPK